MNFSKKLDKQAIKRSEKLKRKLNITKKKINNKKCLKCGKRKTIHHFLCNSCWEKKQKGGKYGRF